MFNDCPDRLTAEDRAIIAEAETALANGLELKRWWEETGGSPALHRFELILSFNRPEEAYGFFDVAPLNGKPSSSCDRWLGMQRSGSKSSCTETPMCTAALPGTSSRPWKSGTPKSRS